MQADFGRHVYAVSSDTLVRLASGLSEQYVKREKERERRRGREGEGVTVILFLCVISGEKERERRRGREGEGVRVFWDRLREPSFSSRWNPFATDYPFCTFTYHPVRNIDHSFTALCDIQSFREQLTEAAQKAHLKTPVPGKANGVLVLNQPLLIEAYVGLMSYIGNQNKLGYSLARGNVGF
ncbi:tumor protein p63-regulated gene 1-like protein [Salvelinus alpinus]